MTHEESAIVEFLKSSPTGFFSRREIARKAVKRELYDENQHWVDIHLAALVARSVVEQNKEGLYRLKAEDVANL